MWFRSNGGAVPVGHQALGVVAYALNYGVYVFASLAAVSVALGIAGVAQARQRRHLAAAALVVNAVAAILWILIMSATS
jgi:hypothetical protein